MTDRTPLPAGAPAAPVPAAPRRPSVPAVGWGVAFLVWTAFVWVGRIRNAVADPALDGGGRTGPVLLSLSFLVPAVVLAGLLVVLIRGRAAARTRSTYRVLLVALAGWTTAVWVVRVADIALGGDHDLAFVVVHTVLGVVSVALGWLAVSATSRSR